MDCNEKPVEAQETEVNLKDNKCNAANSASIYHYMIAHPGSFAAGVSAIVAGIAFVLNAALYRRISAYLRFWGFNADNISIEIGNQIYVIALAFVFCFALAGITWFLCQTFHVFQKRSIALFSLSLDNKYMRREVVKLRIGALINSICVWFCERMGARGEQIEKQKTILAEQKCRLDELSSRITSRLKSLWILRINNAKLLLPSLLIAYGLSFLLMGLTGIPEKLKATVRYPEIALCLVVLFLVALVYWVVRFEFRAERRKIKQKLKKDHDSAYEMIEKMAEESTKRYPVEQLIKSTADELLNNRTIALVAVMLIGSLAYAFTMFSNVDTESTIDKKMFSIVDVDGTKYTITYNCDTTYYLNEVEIDDKQSAIDVFTSKQRIIVSDDIIYDILEFSAVVVDPKQEE